MPVSSRKNPYGKEGDTHQGKSRDQMRTLVVYDSIYGNTEKIAKAIGGAVTGEARVARAGELNPAQLGLVDLLVVGSPTQGGRPTQPVQDFLAGIPATAIKGVRVAAFDTRYAGRFVRVFGYAADKIASSLETKGGTLVSPPEGFFVTGKKGPIKDGELERAVSWAREMVR